MISIYGPGLPGGGPVLGPGTLATKSQKSKARLTKIYTPYKPALNTNSTKKFPVLLLY